MRIKTFDGNKPHKSWGGWRKFLNSCEVRDQHDGVIFYGSVNCNYILFPCGTLIQNYGFNGKVTMSKVREKGATQTLAEYRQAYEATRQATMNLCSSLDRLTATISRLRQKRLQPA